MVNLQELDLRIGGDNTIGPKGASELGKNIENLLNLKILHI